ncbi:hypothetical protein CC86DRAFT_135361 [Ophiobolus disseminans]|uniref:Uncharacterized protein n=1 Tax=Ophiobolus disseminans TaxID=1469910 RepID=A0A6A7AEM9_9PLEO|nr:hypothetical protein CC86DRAFT_135361 [Ophiobolus disseminans]
MMEELAVILLRYVYNGTDMPHSASPLQITSSDIIFPAPPKTLHHHPTGAGSALRCQQRQKNLVETLEHSRRLLRHVPHIDVPRWHKGLRPRIHNIIHINNYISFTNPSHEVFSRLALVLVLRQAVRPLANKDRAWHDDAPRTRKCSSQR